MKKSISSLAALVLLASCSITAPEETAIFDWFTYEGHDDAYITETLPSEGGYYNPVLQGSYTAPSVCTDGAGNYYMVTASYTYFPGIPVLHSRDLVNWEQIGNVIERPGQIPGFMNQRTSEGIFSADIAYHKQSGNYYVISYDVNRGTFLYQASSPAGPWTDPIRLPDVSGLDPSLFFDEDGSAYVFFNDNPGSRPAYAGHKTIRGLKIDLEKAETYGGKPVLVDMGADPASKPAWVKGPRMIKKDGAYWLFCTEGIGTDAQVTLFRGSSAMGPFEAVQKTPVLSQRGLPADRKHPVTGTGHLNMVQDASGQWWALFSGSRPNEKDFDNLGFETFLLPATWTASAAPQILAEGQSVPMVVKAPVKQDPDNSGNFSFHDDFDGSELKAGWLTERGPVDKAWSLTRTPGYLTMAYYKVKPTALDTPAMLVRRIQHSRFTASTRLYSSPVKASEAAGIVLFKDERHQYYLYVNKHEVSLVQNKMVMVMTDTDRHLAPDNEILASKPLKKVKYVDLRVSSDGKDIMFEYSVNGKRWRSLPVVGDAAFLSSADASGFTGATVGLMTVK